MTGKPGTDRAGSVYGCGPPQLMPMTTRTQDHPARGARLKKKTAPSRARRGNGVGGVPATFIPPMKAVSVDVVPPGRWRLEIKLDGYRAIAVINSGVVELWSRNYKPLTADYPEITAALRQLKCRNAVLDGEIVALDEEGRTRFQLLQGRGLKGARAPVVFYVFDLLHQDGRSLLGRPIEERQAALQALLGGKPGLVRISPVFEVAPEVLLQEVGARGLEGIIAKQPGSNYEPDRRSGAWLKCKVMGEQEFVIGGYTPPKNSRPHIGALLLGYYEKGDFVYAGKVGSGFDRARLKSLHSEFQKRRTHACPFVNLPLGRQSRFGATMNSAAMREVTWLKPALVCQVRFAEWTQDGLLRQPVFLGLRHDKPAKEVVREAGPAPA